jgi:uncharacterized protein YkwD
MLSARKRRLVARSSTLLAGVAFTAAVPSTSSAQPGVTVPPITLPAPVGAPSVVPAPVAVASRGCRGAGARPSRASSALLRRAMLCLVNRTRAQAGRGGFRAERRLTRAANRHAADMGRRNYFGHVSLSGRSPAARARAAGWRGSVGEVIAWGCGALATPRATLHAWLNSPPHRAILLGSGRAAGVGVKRLSGCGGRAYWVIDVG